MVFVFLGGWDSPFSVSLFTLIHPLAPVDAKLLYFGLIIEQIPHFIAKVTLTKVIL